MNTSKAALVLLLVVAACSEKYIPFAELDGYTPGNVFKIPTQLSTSDTITITLSWSGSATFLIGIRKQGDDFTSAFTASTMYSVSPLTYTYIPTTSTFYLVQIVLASGQ